MQFVVIARDGVDGTALERRLAARAGHMSNVAPMARDGRLLLGGATLDAAGQMVGSVAVVDFPDEAAVRAWLAADPYVTGDVWREVQVIPFLVAPLPYRALPGADLPSAVGGA